jgi:hypothetical protein
MANRKTTDDIGLMKESVFLDRIAGISIIGKNVKDELQKCPKLRNACGHPNSMRISTNATANHLEIRKSRIIKAILIDRRDAVAGR